MRSTAVILRRLSLVVVLCACSSSPDLRSPPDAGSPPGDAQSTPADAQSTPADARAVNCQGACTLQASYTISTDGYFAGPLDRAFLAPPQSFRHETRSGQPMACAPAIPACTPGGPLSMCDISQDLLDDDVTKALAEAKPPFFGEDNRGVDGEAFSFIRADGHGFEVSHSACQSQGCRPTPPGIQRLVDDLLLLDGAVIQTPECQALQVPLFVAGRTRN
jgi:hypothetical protein